MIGFWNCCGGITGKLSTVELIIKKFTLEILFISEAEYRSSMTWIHISGYELLTTMTEKFGKIRLVAFVRAGTGFKVSKLTTIGDDLEIICLENHQQRVAGLYRPFKQINNNTLSTYLIKMMAALDSIAKTNKPVMIGGDFNVNFGRESHEKSTLVNFAVQNDLIQLIQRPTWRRIVNTDKGPEQRVSILDLVFTSDPENTSVVIEDNLTSDHSLILVKHTLTSEISRKK